jgi:hypothetical protein
MNRRVAMTGADHGIIFDAHVRNACVDRDVDETMATMSSAHSHTSRL